MFWCLWKWKYPQVRVSVSNRKCHASSSPLTNKQNRVVNYNIMSYSTTQNNARVSEHSQILLACTLPFSSVKKNRGTNTKTDSATYIMAANFIFAILWWGSFWKGLLMTNFAAAVLLNSIMELNLTFQQKRRQRPSAARSIQSYAIRVQIQNIRVQIGYRIWQNDYFSFYKTEEDLVTAGRKQPAAWREWVFCLVGW